MYQRVLVAGDRAVRMCCINTLPVLCVFVLQEHANTARIADLESQLRRSNSLNSQLRKSRGEVSYTVITVYMRA